MWRRRIDRKSPLFGQHSVDPAAAVRGNHVDNLLQRIARKPFGREDLANLLALALRRVVDMPFLDAAITIDHLRIRSRLEVIAHRHAEAVRQNIGEAEHERNAGSQLGARYGSQRSLGIYGDSKAALNDALQALAPAWGRQGLIGIVMHPGWVRTDMGGASASLSVQESVTGMRQVIARLTSAESGRFWTWDGRKHSW